MYFKIASVLFVSFASVTICKPIGNYFTVVSKDDNLHKTKMNKNEDKTGSKKEAFWYNSQKNKTIKNNVDANLNLIGDEFETLSLNEGKYSSITIEDESGTTEIKKWGEAKPLEYKNLDNYEDNDSLENATPFFEENINHYYNFYSCISGTISQKSGWFWQTYIDKDFFNIDVNLTGKMVIKLKNIPLNCDYDLRLYKQPNTLNSSVKECTVIATSQKANNQNEEIVCDVTPGSYYIEIYSYNDKSYDNNNRYLMSVEISEKEEYEDLCYYVQSGKKTGDIGAVWISDFDPMGIQPISSKNNENRHYYDCYDKYPLIKNLATNFRDNDLPYCVFYIRNLDLRKALSLTAQKLLDEIDGYNEWNDTQKKVVSFICDVGSIIFQINSKTLKTIPLASFIYNCGSIGLDIVGSCLNLILPSEWDINKVNLREYLINLRAAMEVGLGSNEDEIIMLRLNYHFSEENRLGVKRYLDYNPRFDNKDNHYNDIVIPAHNDDTPIMGKITGFKSKDSIEGIFKNR